MSISPNLGAFSRHLTNLRTVPTIRNVKAGVLRFLRRIPGAGKFLARTADAFQDSLYYFFSPSKEAVVFEEFGFTYLGPFDGHNLPGIIQVLNSAKKLEDSDPILIHFLTKKGKGYDPSEKDATTFHGVGAFNIIDGKIERKTGVAPSYTSVFSDALCMIGQQDPKVVVVTAAMADGTGTLNFRNCFPGRFHDVGIAEQFAVTFCAGLARGGMKPVAAIYSTFLQRAFDQIIHDVALQNLGVFFVLDRGGLVGDDGETHQGAFDLSYLRLIPNMVIMSPKDENELKDMLYTGVEYDGPIAMRYPRGSSEGVKIEEGFHKLPIGKGEIVREGADLCIIAIGHIVNPALDAAELLADDGIDACVINARFVKPLDEELIIEKARATGKVLTCEENALIGGFGSGVSELLHREGIECVFDMVGLPDKFIEHGKQSVLRSKYGLDKTGIYEKAKQLMVAGKSIGKHKGET
jgi:1-deoxy-D-xylulose-5-phosphate synthase